jgi:hypothetical protein
MSSVFTWHKQMIGESMRSHELRLVPPLRRRLMLARRVGGRSTVWSEQVVPSVLESDQPVPSALSFVTGAGGRL